MSKPTPIHRIADLLRAPGELAFEARIAGAEPRRLWIRSATRVTPPADPALALCLMPAMRAGGRLELEERISPRLLRSQREYQAIQRVWSRDWDFDQEPLREVEVSAPPRAPAPRLGGGVAAFFSGGVDSWATVLENPDVTDLIFVRGLDLVPGAAHQADLADEVEARLRDGAGALGLALHVVETNVRRLSDPLVRWEAYNANPMAAIALFFEPLFARVLIAGDTDHETQVPLGTSRMVNQLWSTEQLEIVDDGGRLSREQRLRRIAAHPVVRQTLRVCWENPGGAYNCGRCRKCLLTMISLEAIGAREQVATFPPQLDLAPLEQSEIRQPISLLLWEDVLETTRAAGRSDLERAVEPLVARGRRNLGLPASYRSRRPGGGMVAALTEAERRAEAAELARDEARAQLATVLGSRSWRLLAPLRRLRALLRHR
jgi:hypothetical protein